MRVLQMYFEKVVGQTATLMEFGLSLNTQARLRVLFGRILTTNMDMELALAAAFYDPDRLFSFELHGPLEEQGPPPFLVGGPESQLVSEAVCMPTFVDFGIPGDLIVPTPNDRIKRYKTERKSLPLIVLAAPICTSVRNKRGTESPDLHELKHICRGWAHSLGRSAHEPQAKRIQAAALPFVTFDQRHPINPVSEFPRMTWDLPKTICGEDPKSKGLEDIAGFYHSAHSAMGIVTVKYAHQDKKAFKKMWTLRAQQCVIMLQTGQIQLDIRIEKANGRDRRGREGESDGDEQEFAPFNLKGAATAVAQTIGND